MKSPALSGAEVLLIDVIDDMDFPEGGQLLKRQLPVGRGLETF